jgi:predicted nucleic acid-binding protein
VPFVLDASTALAWCFDDESSPYADAVLDRLDGDTAVVPSSWPLEMANALWSAERRGRLTRADSTEVAELLKGLRIEIVAPSLSLSLGHILDLARSQALTIYDASYLALAIREAAPLATIDARLRAAATQIGVALVP